MANELTPILQVARDILKTAGIKGMYIRDIAEAAISQNKNMGLPADALCKKLQAAIAGNLKLKTGKPIFAKVNWDKGSKKGKPKQGWYRLKIERAAPVENTVQAPKIDKSFFGRAGEYAVMSELLFWGFNASIMSVDDGIDIVASKYSKFFHIQVKTAACQENGKFQFTIKQEAFKRYNSADMFYVFVMRQGTRNEFIIIPSFNISFFIGAGIISGSTAYTLVISQNEKKTQFFLNGGKADITQFYGRFEEIIMGKMG
ncbi:hypothetical protein LJC59_01360 [Desulfovibrio sp. OttesenSCG-928-A18]|nr:hypothetical protein [Desulfovibrio sp. OttesenSCG-928-A18]